MGLLNTADAVAMDFNVAGLKVSQGMKESSCLQAMLEGFQGHFNRHQAPLRDRLREDLKSIDVLVLVMQGQADQFVPLENSVVRLRQALEERNTEVCPALHQGCSHTRRGHQVGSSRVPRDVEKKASSFVFRCSHTETKNQAGFHDTQPGGMLMINVDLVPTHKSTITKNLLASTMILLGFAAILTPWVAGIGVSILVGSVILLAGVAYAVCAFSARGTGTFLRRVLLGAAFAIVGMYLLGNPLLGVVTFTLILSTIFLVEGTVELASYFALRLQPRSGVLLLNALFSFALAFLIWRNWPSSSAWAIGTLVGINLISNGLTRLLFAPF